MCTVTVCLQQKAVVELLRGPQADDKQGYIPQCDPSTGKFQPRQCSLNGLLCWCVDSETGSQIHGSMAPASSVDCTAARTKEDTEAVICKESCDIPCKSGYKRDAQGCALCECIDPCESIQCPEDSECMLIKMEPCLSDTCLPIPTCHRKASKACSFGSPLVSNSTGMTIICQGDCPVSYSCEIASGETTGVCCPGSDTTTTTTTTVVPPIPGEPISCPEYIPDTIPCDNSTSCVNDGDCSSGKLCCISQTCGPMCVAHRLPTMCEYLREMSYQLARQEIPQRLALPVPHCAADGSYLPRQCDQEHCWCVDDFGTEMRGSRVPAYQPLDCSLDTLKIQSHTHINLHTCVCLQRGRDSTAKVWCVDWDVTTALRSTTLPAVPCVTVATPARGGGSLEESGKQRFDAVRSRDGDQFKKDKLQDDTAIYLRQEQIMNDKEKIRNEREVHKSSQCPSGEECRVVEAHCQAEWCPPVPLCMTAERAAPTPAPTTPSCPVGSPMMFRDGNLPVTCDPYSKYQQCPDTHTCVLVSSAPRPEGVCCPHYEDTWSSEEDEDHHERNIVVLEKNGTCPPVMEASSCEGSCDSDEDCVGVQKCCLNSCGTRSCLNPQGKYSGAVFFQCTSVEYLILLIYIFKPRVWKERDGQCPYLLPHHVDQHCSVRCSHDEDCGDPGHKCCSTGCGTACTAPLNLTHCQHSRMVALHSARELGLSTSRTFHPACDPPFRRIPTSSMRPSHPCLLGVTCSNPVEECHMVQVRCSSEPCLPLPLCKHSWHVVGVPRADNPCLNGEPLPDPGSGAPLKCGPTGSQCPASHQCQLSPLGEFAVCCPKPREYPKRTPKVVIIFIFRCGSPWFQPGRDVCYEPMSAGPCDHFSTRWHYNRHSNQCERFTYGGCGGTPNNFETREQCMATCAGSNVTSTLSVVQDWLYSPREPDGDGLCDRCNKKTHEWEPVQCLESVGLCWCVTPQGDQIPGTVVRGVPHCNAREYHSVHCLFTADLPSVAGSGRTYTGDDPLCEDGRPAHVCPPDLCEGKVCLAYRNATCRVNPCGGCHANFYNEFNRQVDCDEGLSACHTELQAVVNSPALSAHRLPSEDVERVLPPRTTDSPPILPPPPPYPHGHDEQPMVAVQDDDLQAEPSHISVLVIAAPVSRHQPAEAEVTLQLPSLLQRFLALAAASTSAPAVSKPGSCPPQGLLWCASGSQPCHRDDHCPGENKCCPARCGHSICSAISHPSQETSKPLRPPYMVVPLPTCSPEGGYAVTQRQEDLSWCVDELGNPLHHTLTRGDVICDHNGTVLHRDPIGPVCLDGGQPRVCKSECLSATCHLHPDAICVADPCRGCQVTFVNLQGEKLDCQGPCQEPARVRPCPDLQTNFYFNQSSQRCESLRGGRGLCLAGPNQFTSRDDCQASCVTPVAVCEQPREVGMCRAQIPRWFYNSQRHQCEPFYFGGCGGNDNNFESKAACEARCPDLVMCPWATVTGRYDVEPCSRTLACAGATCPGHPDALCTADPCTCAASFVDSNGEPLDCDTPATETDKDERGRSLEQMLPRWERSDN
ncbi:hypothetical protein LAZ67_16001118 [Cordylochernes scorpioides]|uniref:BPTI/Kunitz inhibitor domain-containing protein n=1 Tax=Cordylochernes scorpioides TaxID=51811 RepID=A0ABY6LB32_9ARAC|nr:hypothetical protein LAZ67_16001118 [Cordylochernes scorpioides]